MVQFKDIVWKIPWDVGHLIADETRALKGQVIETASVKKRLAPQIMPEPISVFISKYQLKHMCKGLWVSSSAVFNFVWEWHSDTAGFLPQPLNP